MRHVGAKPRSSGEGSRPVWGMQPARRRLQSRRMRVARAVFSALIVLAVLATAAVAYAARDPHREQERLTAADNALAKRALANAGDLGAGWKRTAVEGDEDEPTRCAGYDPDFSAFTITGKARIAFVQPTGSSIVSTVDVLKTRAQAAADFRLGATPAFAGCFGKLLGREFAKGGVPVEIVSSRMMSAPRVGEQSAAFRVVAKLQSGGSSVSLTMDLLAVQRGRSLAGLFFTGVGKPLAGQRELARTVAGRMR